MTALSTFTTNYLPEAGVIDVDLAHDVEPNRHIWVRVTSRSGRVLLLDIRDIAVGEDGEHLCIDAFPFIDGKDAAVGYFGMTSGKTHQAPPTGVTSHGWPASHMGVLLLGKQGADSESPADAEKTWTFCGHWANDDKLVVEYSLEGEVADTREDKGYHEGGLWASSASGRTEFEAQARALAEYQDELLSRVVEKALDNAEQAQKVIDEDTWFEALLALGWTDEQISDALSSRYA